MSQINLILGGSGYGKSEYVFRNTIEKSYENSEKNYIFIVPEQMTMETQKAVVSRHKNKGIINIDVLSFNRLAFKVFEELSINGLSVLDDTGKTLILRKVIEDNKDKLNIYREKVNQTGFVEEMKSAISELYSYGIDLDEFENVKEKMKDKPYISEKLKDIGMIYGEFKKVIGEKYITKEEILTKLCHVCMKSKIIKNSEFVFDGFTGFTPIQYQFLDVLLSLGSKITVTVTIDERELTNITGTGFKEIKEQELFNLSKTTINKIFEIASNNHISIDIEKDIIVSSHTNLRHTDNKTLSFLERNLFREEKVCEDSEGIRVLSFDNQIKEAKYVAAYINKNVREKGMRYRDFAVITGDVDTYRKILETSFVQNEIPYFMDNKRRLILNPIVEGLRAALLMIEKDFSYESVFKFLRCNLTDISADETDILENYVLEYGVRGYNVYSKEFKKLRQKSKQYILEQVNIVRAAFIDAVKELRESVSGREKTVSEYTKALYEFTEKLCVYELLKKYEEKFNEMGELSLSKEYSQAYGQILELMDKLISLMGDTKVSLKEYIKLLDSGFAEIKVGVIPLNVDSVVVGDIERTRLNNIKVLFVLGVNDGIIPKSGMKNGLLNNKDRGYLKKADVNLSPTSRESIFIQRFYLYQNLTKPTDELIMTYALSTNEGKTVRPSYLVQSILGMYKDKEKITDKETGVNIYTKQMGLKYISENFVNREKELSPLTKELFSYFSKDEENKKILKKVVDGAFFSMKAGKLENAISKVLYGDDVILSSSRLEKYASCAYAHFLGYGLKLCERKIYEISAADIGTIYHRIIEDFSKQMTKENLDFRKITDKDRERILDKCMENISKNESGDVFFDTQRNMHLLNRIKFVSDKTIWAISEHIKAGDFEPSDFEMKFSDGRVDRVDTYENDDRMYVKIIDYKTGNKKFDIDEVMNGLSIQLVYYMGAVLDVEKGNAPDKCVMPGGAMYFNVKSPFIERLPEDNKIDMTKEEREILSKKYKEALLKEYQMSGMVNSDKEPAGALDNALNNGENSYIIPLKAKEMDIHMGKQFMGSNNFTKLIEYVRNKAEKMCDEIIDGKIEANPYKKGLKTSCDYCKFKGLCTFNEKYTGGKFRTLGSYSNEEILEMMGVGENGKNEMD